MIFGFHWINPHRWNSCSRDTQLPSHQLCQSNCKQGLICPLIINNISNPACCVGPLLRSDLYGGNCLIVLMIWLNIGLPLTCSPIPHCLVLHSDWNSYSESPDYTSCQQQQQHCRLHCSLLWEQWPWTACVGGFLCGLGPDLSWHSCGIYSSHQSACISTGPQASSSPQPCHPAQLTVPEAGSYISGPGTVA